MKKALTNRRLQFHGILAAGNMSSFLFTYYEGFSSCSSQLLAFSIGLSVVLAVWSHKFVFNTLDVAKKELSLLKEGQQITEDVHTIRDPQIVESLSDLSRTLSGATHMAKNLGSDNHDATNANVDVSLPLIAALNETHHHLIRLKDEEEKRNWVIQGVGKLNELIHQNLDSSIDVLGDLLVSKMVHHLGAVQGGLFLLQEEKEDAYISMIACYAYDRKKYLKRRIEIGEGIVGECIRDQDLAYLTDVPEKYVKISSGLGDAPPRNVIIAPLKTSDKTIGAIEIASFEIMGEHKVELIKKVCENLATTIVIMQNNWRNKELLNQADLTEQTLREKEMVLMQNAEELTATQEELNRKLIQIEQESNLTHNILSAINKSNAMVEYDMQGCIREANELYLNVMGFVKQEVIGQTDQMMLTQEESATINLNMLWDSLRQGQFNSGQFKRLSKNGQEVWIEASFNPILDLEGRPFKVLMLAQFITDTLSKENDLKNKIHALNESYPFAELTFDHKIKYCNALFMSLFGLTRKTNKEFNISQFMAKQNIVFDNPKEYFEMHIAEQKSIQKNYELTLSDGQSHQLSFSFSPLKDLNGRLTGFGLIIDDFSQHVVANKVVKLKVG